MPDSNFKYSKTFILGFGFFGVSLIWSLYNAFIPIFLKEFAISSFLVGFIMTFDNILAVVLQPYIGFLSDNTRTKFGRRMPYILIGAPLAALFFLLIPFMKSFGMLPMILVIIIMNVAMAIFRSPVIALMPDITPSVFRSKANGIINFMGGFGALLAFFVGSKLYDISQSLPFAVGCITLVLSAFFVVRFIKEPAEYRIKNAKTENLYKDFSSNSENKNNGKLNFTSAFADLFSSLKHIFLSKEKSEMFVLLAIFFWFCGFGAIETFFTSYGKFYIGISESDAAFTLGLFSLSFMIFSIPAGIIGTKIGRKTTILSGLGILIAMMLIIRGSKDINFIKMMLVMGGLGWACVNINSLPMVVDMVSSKKVGGHTGLYYFFSMLAAITAPPIVGILIDVFSYTSMMWFSLGGFSLAFIMMLFVKKGEAIKEID